jgi:hypothetical protein
VNRSGCATRYCWLFAFPRTSKTPAGCPSGRRINWRYQLRITRTKPAKYNHNMSAQLPIDHRAALVALMGLLVAAGVPLAFGWARLLPEEPPPFPIEPGSFPSVDEEVTQEPSSKPGWGPTLSIILLGCLTLAYVIRFPGFPSARLARWLGGMVSGSTERRLFVSANVVVPLVGVAAGVYAAFRPGSLRIPLLAAAVLVLLLWFLASMLQLAVLGGS